MDKELKIIIAIIIATIIVAALVVLYINLHSQFSVKKRVNEINKKYDEIHNLLHNQLSKELKRVYSIAQINVEYENVYSVNHDLYQEVIANEDADAHEAITYLSKLLFDKKYKQIKEEIENTRAKIIVLEEKCAVLSKSIGEIVNVDDENRQEILKYRRQFREIKSLYEMHKGELKYIEMSFMSVFEKIDEYFTESEKQLAGAHYAESKEKLPEVEKVIKALEKTIYVLPKLVVNAFVVLPTKLNDLTERYNSLVSQNYPLHHLMFQSNCDTFNKMLDDIRRRLENFQVKNVEYQLNVIRDGILQLNRNFDEEEKSKSYFQENYDTTYNGSLKIENKFIKLRRNLAEYKTTYILRESCIDDIDKIQREINDLGSIKRNLDTYVHSSSQQPYSILAKRLKDLADAMNQIENDIETIQKYLVSLKADTERGYEYITKCYLSLKKYEATLREINVPSVSNNLKNSFEQCYEYLSRCGEIIVSLPIDVETINNYLDSTDALFRSINDQITSLPELVSNAELAIVHANQYRQEFREVKVVLLRAEKAFFEGDFVRASDETITMIKKIRPELGK